MYTGITDCGDKPATNVISSYHFNPDLTDPTISPVVQRQCTEIGKVCLSPFLLPASMHAHDDLYPQLVLTAITLIASTGDGGVAYSQSHECLLPSGALVAANPSNSSFAGQLPASCPFITAVGATRVAPWGSASVS
jgi:tripeptidyl-peptidase-1